VEALSLVEVGIKCPECGEVRFARDPDRAELTCLRCGLVLRDKLIDPGPEWRAFDLEQQDRRARIGAPLTYTIHDMGLSTVIDWANKDASGKGLTPAGRVQSYKLRRWQQRLHLSSALERNLAQALSELERVASQLGLPRSVKEEAALIYRRAAESKLIRGRSIKSMVVAAIYMACRKAKLPRTLSEVASASQVEKKEVGRSYRFLLHSTLTRVTPMAPISYVPKLMSKLKLPSEVQVEAIKILEKAAQVGLTSGRGPMGMVAAAIYIASALLQCKCPQREVASSANVTEVTVRNRYQELLRKLDFIVMI
jgi:transcription initiation factor TFIIB